MNYLKKKVSMQDIADELGLSKHAISLALGGKNGVSKETRELVIATAKRMNYGGLNPSGEKGNKILVLIPESIRNESYFYNRVYWAVEEQAKNLNYVAMLVIVSDKMEKNNELPAIYYEMDIAGIILVGVFSESYVRYIRTQTEFIVSADQYYSDTQINTILTANTQGSYTITKYVIESGHRKIGFLGPVLVTSSVYERWNGYMLAMHRAGIDINHEFSILDSSPLGVMFGDKENLLGYLKKIRNLPTAWVTGGDRMAITLIEALRDLNIKVPDDISVVGFDNIEASAFIQPPLTTIAVKRELIGTLAVDRLINMFTSNDVLTTTLISTDLIIRNSVKPPKELGVRS